MTEDKFLERLREDARQLRYEPADGVTWTRLAAGINEQVQSQPGVAQLLAAWFRPIATSLAALSIVAAVSVAWIERSHEVSPIEAMASSPSVEIAVDGDIFSVE